MIYDILDHTADIRLKVYGNLYKSIFENFIMTFLDLTYTGRDHSY
jgi:SHS2 domain-containing protein